MLSPTDREVGAAGRWRWPRTQHDLDPRQQLARIEGFGDVVVRPGLQPDNLVHIVTAPGHQDDAQVLVPGPQLACQLQTILAGQADIEQNHIDDLALQQRPHLAAARRGQDSVALLPEIAFQPRAGHGIIVNNQQAGRAVRIHGDRFIPWGIRSTDARF